MEPHIDKCPAFAHVLVVPRLRVQNANAISSPHTHGFPAMTAFLGLMWALERKTIAAGLDLQFNAVAVVVHRHQELTTDDTFVKRLRVTRNPVRRDGKSAAIVEEGRIHIELSLVFAVQSDSMEMANEATRRETVQQVKDIILQMRIAGGSVVPPSAKGLRRRPQPYLASASDFEKIKMRLLPGFALVERQDILEKRYQSLAEHNPKVSRLDAWLSLSRINWHWREDENGRSGCWQHDRADLGWLAPIPVGYGALTDVQEPGTVANARDKRAPFCFVESLFGIGEWVSPHRIDRLEKMLWYADSRPEQGLYRCRNDYSVTPAFDFD